MERERGRIKTYKKCDVEDNKLQVEVPITILSVTRMIQPIKAVICAVIYFTENKLMKHIF